MFNLILDSYIRIRYAFLEMDEFWLYLIQYSYSSAQEYIQAGPHLECLFEQLLKRIFGEILSENYISAFKLTCTMSHQEMRSQFITLENELRHVGTYSDVRQRVEARFSGGYSLA